MSIRSMTGFAQVKAQVNDHLGFTLSLKSVNHRFLDLHMRMPSETDGLEMKMRRLLKDRIARGHVELTLSFERGGDDGVSLNRQLVGGYLAAFRAAADEFGVSSEPDLNAILKLPGALEGGSGVEDETFEKLALSKLDEAISRLDQMRGDEGKAIERELRERIEKLKTATAEIDKTRSVVLQAYMEKLQGRLQELTGAQVAPERIMQEAAVMAERSDISGRGCANADAHPALSRFDRWRQRGGKEDGLPASGNGSRSQHAACRRRPAFRAKR